jgi:hypothetical protein
MVPVVALPRDTVHARPIRARACVRGCACTGTRDSPLRSRANGAALDRIHTPGTTRSWARLGTCRARPTRPITATAPVAAGAVAAADALGARRPGLRVALAARVVVADAVRLAHALRLAGDVVARAARLRVAGAVLLARVRLAGDIVARARPVRWIAGAPLARVLRLADDVPVGAEPGIAVADCGLARLLIAGILGRALLRRADVRWNWVALLVGIAPHHARGGLAHARVRVTARDLNAALGDACAELAGVLVPGFRRALLRAQASTGTSGVRGEGAGAERPTLVASAASAASGARGCG